MSDNNHEKLETNKDKEKVTEVMSEGDNNNKKTCLSFFIDMYEEFRALGISTQFLFCYFVFLGIFVFILIYSKIKQTEEIMTKQTNYYFYNTTIRNILEKQQLINVHLQQFNAATYQKLVYQHLFLLKIYSRELQTHELLSFSNSTQGYINVPFNFNGTDNLSLFSIMTDSNYEYKLLRDLKGLNDDFIFKQAPGTSTYSLGLLIPHLYLTCPLLTQRSSYGGLTIVNYKFLAYEVDDNNNCVPGDNTNIFFKYPYEKIELSSPQKNTDIFDIVIDPIGKCFINKTSANHTLIKKNNWFYNWEANFLSSSKQSDFNSIVLLRQSENYRNDEYVVISFLNKYNYGSKKLVYSITMKILRNSNISSIVQKDFYTNDANNKINYMTFWNSYNKPKYRIKIDSKDQLYYNKYNIDDNNILFITNPNELNNIYRYGMEPYNLTGINVNSLMLTKDSIDNFKNLSENFYYSMDNLFYVYADFANTFYQNERLYNLSNGSISLDKCSLNNLTDYYTTYKTAQENSLSYYKSGVMYDCLNDACHYVNCYNDSDLTSFRTVFDAYSQYPNCLCMPMYCYNNNSIIPDEYKVFRKKNKTLNKPCYFNFERMKTFTTGEYYTKYIIYAFQDPLNYNFGSSSLNLFLAEQTQEIVILNSHWDGANVLKVAIYIFYSLTLLVICLCFFKITSVKFAVFNSRIDDSITMLDEIIMVKEEQIYSTQKEDEQPKDEANHLIEGLQVGPNEGANKVEMSPEKDGQQNQPTLKDKKKLNRSETVKQKEKTSDDLDVENCEDELDEIKTLIMNNRNEFKIDFDSNKNIFMEDKTILQFIVEVKKQKYLLNFATENNKKNFLKGNDSFIENMFENRIESTVHILSELLSTEMIFFEKINQNFYFTEKGRPPKNKNKFADLIEKNLYDEQVRVNEIMVDKVIESLISYYFDEISDKWVNKIVNI